MLGWVSAVHEEMYEVESHASSDAKWTETKIHSGALRGIKTLSCGNEWPNHSKAFSLYVVKQKKNTGFCHWSNAHIFQSASIKRKPDEIYYPGLTVW